MTTLSTLREDLRVLMLPWVSVLRDYVDLGEWHAAWDAQGDRVVHVQMVSDAPRGIEPRAFDALELLALVGAIDFVAWRVALAASWPRHAGLWLEAANGRALRLGWRVVFNASDDASKIAECCDRMVVDGVARTRSREYLRARTVLENLLQSKTAMATRPLEVPVQLVLKGGSLEPRLLQVLELAALQHARNSSPLSLFSSDRWRPLMRITDMEIDDSLAIQSPKAFLYASQLTALGIRLNQLVLDRLDITVDTAMLHITGLQHLFGDRGVESVSVPSVMSRHAIAAVYSALATSPFLRTVAINEPPRGVNPGDGMVQMRSGDRECLWQWIAASLFSSRASNHVYRIHIDVGELCQKDIVSMERALCHPIPLQAATLSVGSPDHHGDVAQYVTATKFRLLSPETEAPQGVDAVVDLEKQTVQVLQAESDGWCVVLLPGWGTAWVHKDDCEGLTTRASDPSTVRSIARMKFSNVTAANSTPVVSFLRLVGRDVRSLELVDTQVAEPLDDTLSAVLQVTPHLEELKVAYGGRIATLDTLIDAYERGYCRLRDFTLSHTLLENEESLLHVLQALADPKHPIYRHLRGLSLSCSSRMRLTGLSEALRTMLKVNTTLESVRIHVNFLVPVPQEELLQRRAFAVYETPIAVRMLPLSVSKKAAFLSVTSARRGDAAKLTCAAEQLDSRVFSLIFQFAAQSRKRTVDVKCSKLRS